MKTSLFEYGLPEEAIAQRPVRPRDKSKLLVLERATGRLTHHVFGDLPSFLRTGDLLVLNDTRVIPARITVSL